MSLDCENSLGGWVFWTTKRGTSLFLTLGAGFLSFLIVTRQDEIQERFLT